MIGLSPGGALQIVDITLYEIICFINEKKLGQGICNGHSQRVIKSIFLAEMGFI